MTSSEIAAILERIAGTSSKKDKEALVAAHVGYPEFVRVLQAAYNPFIRYGVSNETLSKVFCGGSTPGADFDAHTWELLDQLASGQLSGDAAVQEITGEFVRLNVESVGLLQSILLKDLRAGFAESTINKAKKGTIPTFPYMRCSLIKDVKLVEWPWFEGVISQEKADGMFANCNRKNGKAWFVSRQGSTMHLPALEAEAAQILDEDTQTHGELLVFKDGVVLPREQSNGVLNSIISGDGSSLAPGMEIRYHVWDQIPLAAVVDKGVCNTPYAERLQALDVRQIHQFGDREPELIDMVELRIVTSYERALWHYREKLQQGKEGTIIKRPDMIWKDGTSKGQVKLKLEVDVDLVAKAIVPGKFGTKNEGRAGSITMESACGQLRVDVTVKNEAMRDAIDSNPDQYLQRIYVVRANSIMPPSESSDLHSLFLPRLVEADFRRDKVDADTLERVKAQFESAVSAA
jgi:DNA ligase-1